MATLSDGTTTLALPDQLVWQDEYAWAPVEQTVQRSITGAVLLSVAARTAGRPITLASAGADRAWLPRSTLDQCRTWAAVAGQQLTLTWRGLSYSVLWRHQDTAIDAQEVWPLDDAQSTDDFTATLRFMTV